MTLMTTIVLPSWGECGETVHLSSLDWPPYASPAIKDQGLSVAIVKAAFAKMGRDVSVDFFPWSRTISVVKDSDTPYVAFFPAYYSEKRRQEYYISKPIGTSPVGFIENQNHHIKWNSLKELSSRKIGVVQDYVNTEEFDSMVARGELTTEVVIMDYLNIRKVAANRIDMAVMDKHVFNYLLLTSPELAGLKNNLQFNDHVLEDKQLFLYFRKTAKGKELTDIFNQGLEKIDIKQIENNYRP